LTTYRNCYLSTGLSGICDDVCALGVRVEAGPVRDYWPEFVFEAYVNFDPEVILLTGLPDVPESRPHSRINQNG